MGSLTKQFQTNRKAEAEGVKVTFGGGVTFRIARRSRSNKRYQQMLDKEMKAQAVAIKHETLDPEVDAAISRRIFCHTILLDWKGVRETDIFPESEHTSEETITVDDVTEKRMCIPFTVENAEKLMIALPDLYDELYQNSARMANFKDASTEAEVKNS